MTWSSFAFLEEFSLSPVDKLKVRIKQAYRTSQAQRFGMVQTVGARESIKQDCGTVTGVMNIVEQSSKAEKRILVERIECQKI